MLLIDDLLMAPFKGLLFVLREVQKAANEEQAGDERATMAELAALHRALEDGQLTEAAFDEQETLLLERLDWIRGVDSGADMASHGP
jgi:hypothetical protein